MSQSLLDFTQSVLTEMKIHSRIITSPFAWEDSYDLELRKYIYDFETDYTIFCRDFPKNIQALYNQTSLSVCSDRYGCQYIFLKLPYTNEPSILMIGPFSYIAYTTNHLLELFEHTKIPDHLFDFMQQYYFSLPVAANERWMESLICTLARELWSDEAITIQHYSDIAKDNDHYSSTVNPTPNTLAYMEEKYENESSLMLYITNGDRKSIEEISSHLDISAIKQRFPDSLRDHKNSLIIFNTICRKAAQSGGVHPVYFDAEFNKYLARIEYATSLSQLNTLYREIPRKFCMLVHSYSLKNFSTVIQRSITYISFHLSEDLSLQSIAKNFALNKNYFSTLFKKEVGVSLTAFVNKKRIDHALYLLNTTQMPIQNIAETCGIEDLNYFSRLFKLQIGMPPSQYRKEVKQTGL